MLFRSPHPLSLFRFHAPRYGISHSSPGGGLPCIPARSVSYPSQALSLLLKSASRYKAASHIPAGTLTPLRVRFLPGRYSFSFPAFRPYFFRPSFSLISYNNRASSIEVSIITILFSIYISSIYPNIFCF